MNIIDRVKAPTPKFFAIIRNISLALAGLSASVLAAPIALPVVVMQVAGYMAVAGSVGTAASVAVAGSALGCGSVAVAGSIATAASAGSWRWAVWSYGIMGLAVATYFWVSFRENPRAHPLCNEAERALLEEGHEPATISAGRERRRLGRRRIHS